MAKSHNLTAYSYLFLVIYLFSMYDLFVIYFSAGYRSYSTIFIVLLGKYFLIHVILNILCCRFLDIYLLMK